MFVRQSGFHGGEVAPHLWSRTDVDALRFATRTLRNFIPTPTGAATSRPGFQFIAAAKVETSAAGDAFPCVRLLPFIISDEQSYILEFGHLYVRVYQHGILKTEVATPYEYWQIAGLDYVQSGNVMTLFSAYYAPRELKRITPSNWTIGTFSVARLIAAPTSAPQLVAPLPPIVADATHAANSWQWVYTATSALNEESLPSPVWAATTQLAPDRAAYLAAPAVTGAVSYNWYRGRFGVWGYIGNSITPYFIDEGQVPNFSDRPPTARDPFADGYYPSRGTYFQQRLLVANSPLGLPRIQASQTGRFHNFDWSSPQKADDALDFTIASRQYDGVMAMVPLRQLVVLTSSTEYLVDNGMGALSPSSINIVPLSYNGCAPLRPIVVNDTVLYVQSQQAAVRELAFATGGADRLGWRGTDLSLISSHLLAAGGRTIVAWDFQRLPYAVVWAVRDDGVLLSFTYDRDLGVSAWARHDTDGAFESVCCVPEGSEDVVYAVVRRVIGGVTHRYIERMSSRFVTTRELGCFLDCSVFYDGSPQQWFGGLSFLEGKQVLALRDGVVEGPITVFNSAVELSQPASKVFIGLPYDSDIELLDIANSFDSQEVRPAQKNVVRAIWEVDRTAGLSAGETFDDLTPWTAELGYVTPSTGVMNEQLVVPIASSWNRGGRAVLRQAQPLPITVLGAVREMEVGN
jgi:hypothetical protein